MPADDHPAPLIQRNMPDPFVLAAGDFYYLYASGEAGDGRFIPIYRSRDLTAWEFVRGAVAQGAEGSCNRRNFWAPEVMFHSGRYWLYYTASPDGTPANTGNRVLVAAADTPEGPFEDTQVLIGKPSLDGSPFADQAGRLWMFFVSEFGGGADWPAGRIFADRLLAPGMVAGEPVEVAGRHEWQEGPCVLERAGRYYLFFSVGSWGKDDYRVRWAVADEPSGPFAEADGTLLKSSPAVKGPGHHNFFRTPDGREWIIYHAWDAGFTARFPRIRPLNWKDGWPVAGPVAR